MASNDASKVFANELQRRFEELVHWAIDNWPDKSQPLTEADFAVSRKEMEKISARQPPSGKGGPEPSEGGEQYVNMNPTPWP